RAASGRGRRASCDGWGASLLPPEDGPTQTKNFRKTTAGPCKLIRLTSAVKISPASNGHDPVSRRRRARRAARSSGPSGGGGGGSAPAVGQLPGLLLRLQRELHGLEGVLLGHRVLGAVQHVEDQIAEERVAQLPGCVGGVLVLSVHAEELAGDVG